MNNLIRMRPRLIGLVASAALLLGGVAPVLAAGPASAATNLLPSDDGAPVGGLPPGYVHTATPAGVTYSVVTGHTGANALQVTQTVNTAHAWMPSPVSATPGTYSFTDYYQSNAASEVGADFYDAAGNYLSYAYLGDMPVCATWCTQSTPLTVTVPTGASMVDIEHDLYKAGMLTIDDLSLTSGATTPPPPPPPTCTAADGAIVNGGLETIDTTTTLPACWGLSQWGTNDGKLSIVSSAHGGTNAVKAQITSFTSGAVDLYQAMPVTAGKTYKVTAAVATNAANVQLAAQGVDASGNELAYQVMANVAANNTGTTVPATPKWTIVSGGFTAPAGAVKANIMVPLGAVGWTIVDDFSSSVISAPTSFANGIVTVALDDGWASGYTNGRTALVNNKIPATFYIIGSEIGDTPDYMSAAQIKTLKTDGNEIGNHTWDHPDAPKTLNTMTATQIDTEFTKAQTAITNKIGVTPTTCAYPEGSYNATVLQEAAKYFKACRSVDPSDNYGANVPGAFAADPQYKYRLMDVNITNASSVTSVKAAIDYAKANKVWVILTYHEIVKTASQNLGGDVYYTLSTEFSSEMAYLHSSGVSVQTLSQGYDTVKGQLP